MKLFDLKILIWLYIKLFTLTSTTYLNIDNMIIWLFAIMYGNYQISANANVNDLNNSIIFRFI